MQREASSTVEAAIAQLEQELAMEKTQEDRQTRSVQGTLILTMTSTSDFFRNLKNSLDGVVQGCQDLETLGGPWWHQGGELHGY